MDPTTRDTRTSPTSSSYNDTVMTPLEREKANTLATMVNKILAHQEARER